MSRGSGLLDLLIKVDTHPPRPANPTPLVHDTDISKQTHSRRQPIESRHVARRIKAMEVDHGFVLHDMIVARAVHAVQRVL